MTTSTPVTVIGAGPYGLSIAAHLRARQVPVRTLGVPMASWRSRMPLGMFLKSAPLASCIADPENRYGLNDFRAAEGQRRVGDQYVIPLDEFIRYGEWFQKRCVPEVERVAAVRIEPAPDGLRLTLESGEEFTSRSVVLATGFPPYARVPVELASLVAAGLASHTVDQPDMAKFEGQRVVVVGAGQSALESAVLLREAGAQPTVVARTGGLVFGTRPEIDQRNARPLVQRLRTPHPLLGPGWPLVAFSRVPAGFRYLPDRTRAHYVRTVLGPAGAWWLRDRLNGGVPVLTGHRLVSAETTDGRALLRLDGPTSTLEADHVLAATGYQVDVERLELLDPSLRRALSRTPEGAPRLSGTFQSSVPGLYFTGLAAADTFGPLMRFVCGTGFAARRISRAIALANGH